MGGETERLRGENGERRRAHFASRFEIAEHVVLLIVAGILGVGCGEPEFTAHIGVGHMILPDRVVIDGKEVDAHSPGIYFYDRTFSSFSEASDVVIEGAGWVAGTQTSAFSVVLADCLRLCRDRCDAAGDFIEAWYDVRFGEDGLQIPGLVVQKCIGTKLSYIP